MEQVKQPLWRARVCPRFSRVVFNVFDRLGVAAVSQSAAVQISKKKILQDRYKIQMLGYLKDSPGLAVSLGLKFNPKPGPMTCTRNLYCLLPEKIQSSSASAAGSGKGAPASGGSHSKGNIAPLEIRHGGGGEPRWSRKPARRLLLRVQYPNHPYL